MVGCQNNQTNNEQEELSVVTSTTMLGDLVANIGPDRVEVTTLFGPGIDPRKIILRAFMNFLLNKGKRKLRP